METASKQFTIDQDRLAKIDGRAKSVPVATRFWSHVKLGPSCWEWVGRRDGKGYGRTSIGGHRNVGAHRVAWELTHGLADKHVLHHCDNPPCCNPAHLFLGTNRENVADRHAKGRSKNLDRGVLHPKAKLTDAQVTEMRELRAAGWIQARLAVRFGISRGNVSKITSGRAY